MVSWACQRSPRRSDDDNCSSSDAGAGQRCRCGPAMPVRASDCWCGPGSRRGQAGRAWTQRESAAADRCDAQGASGQMQFEFCRDWGTHRPNSKRRSPEGSASGRTSRMDQISIGIIGTGWCGGIRAETLCRPPPGARALHIAETRPERLAEVAALTQPGKRHRRPSPADRRSGHRCHHRLVDPRGHPLSHGEGGACWRASTSFWKNRSRRALAEADELIAIARRARPQAHHRLFPALQAAIRLHPREDPRRHPGRAGERAGLAPHHAQPGQAKISGRTKLSPAAMEATHDLDFVLWCLEPRRRGPGLRPGGREGDVQDRQCLRLHVDHRHHGRRRRLHGRRRLDPAAGLSQFFLDLVGVHRLRRGALLIDDSHKDVVLNTMGEGNALSHVEHAGRAGRPHLRRADGQRDHPLRRCGGTRPPGAW